MLPALMASPSPSSSRTRFGARRPLIVALPLSLLGTFGLLGACGDDELVAEAPCDVCPFTGLSAPVDVRRDTSGVVHVYAKTDEDAFFGSGYMQAFDRLFQMELTRRRALGRSAEVFGEGRVGDDKLVHTIDIPRWGRENAALTAAEHPRIHRFAEAWTAGVNRFVEEVENGTSPMPPAFAEMGLTPERWEVSDGYAIGKLLMFGNANQIEFDILSSALRDYSPAILDQIPLLAPLQEAFSVPVDSPPLDLARWGTAEDRRRDGGPTFTLPDDAPQRLARWSETMSRFRPAASNNWAVKGEHTATGRAMIAGDPHQGFSSPTLFWSHHMNSADAGGSLDVAGWSFVGTPGIQLGHNRSIAWTATTNYPDTMDLYDVARPTLDTVVLAGTTVEMVARDVTIAVRDAEPVLHTVYEVPDHGVILPEDLLPLPLVDGALLLAWVGLQPTREAFAFFSFDTARNLEEFDAAVDVMEIGCFNFLAASAEGISYRSSPLVPRRTNPAAHWPYMILDGAEPETFWTGDFLPPEQMPHSRGEERGFIATANNDPFGFTRDASIEGDPWYFGVYYDPGTREARIQERLGQAIDDDGAIGMDEMKALQLDVRSNLAVELVPIAEEALAAAPVDDEAAALQARVDVQRLGRLLAEWDRDMSRPQAAPVAFTGFSYFLTRAVIADDLSLFFGPIAEQQAIYILKFALLALRHPVGGTLQEGRQLLVLRSLAETADWLLAEQGSIDEGYSWGDFHGTSFGSIAGPSLEGGWIATDGGDGTVNVSSARFFGGEDGTRDRLESGGGAIYRMVAEIGEDGVPRAEFNMPRGNSGDPESPHWNDLERDWVAGTYRPLLFANDAIEAATLERRTIAP